MAALSAFGLSCRAMPSSRDASKPRRDELQAELATFQAQAASPKPAAIIKATAEAFKAVLENGLVVYLRRRRCRT